MKSCAVLANIDLPAEDAVALVEENKTLSVRLNEATDEIERLNAAMNSIRDEASSLLNCHIETPNLAKDALRRMRAFVNKTIENSISDTCRECEYYLHDPSESRIPFCRLLKTDTSADGYCEKFERST
jgi:predicted aldo/keto reductase-like oxidoreductase